MAEKIISWIVLVAIFGYLLGIALVFCFKYKGWAEKVDYIKSFKFGKWSILFIISIPLFAVGYISNGNAIADSIFRAFTSTFKLITLSFDFTFKLTDTLLIFQIALYTCYCAVLVNDLLFAASCLFQRVWDAILREKFWTDTNEKCIIIGNNVECRAIFRSIPKKCKAIIVDNMEPDTRDELFKDKIPYKAFRIKKDEKIRDAKLLDYIQKKITTYAKKHIALPDGTTINPCLRIIINTDSVKRNIALTDKISHFYKDLFDKGDNPKATDEEKQIAKVTLRDTQVYVFAKNEHKDIFHSFEDLSKGCIRFLDKHSLIADNFVTSCPFAQYLNENHVDYNTGLIKQGVNLNVVFIGFGKTNQHVFNSILSAFCFLTEKDGIIKPKPLDFYFFDKDETIQNKNLNSYVFRYKEEFLDPKKSEINLKDYLPQPGFAFLKQSDKNEYVMDLNNSDFYTNFKKAVTKTENDFNYIIISLGDDFETLDIVNKLNNKLEQWGIKNFHIFAHINDYSVFNNQMVGDDKHFTKFGCLDKFVFNYDKIVDTFYESLALMQDSIYQGDFRPEATKADILKWNKKSLYERFNSLCAVQSIRNKLALMNLDMVPINSPLAMQNKLTKEEFFKIYAKDFPIEYYPNGNPLDVKDFNTISLRTNMAILEHTRWNNCLLSQGFIPMSLTHFKQNKAANAGKPTKDFIKKEHLCLTTWEGLQRVAELDEETRQYDFHHLDYLPLMLKDSQYVIVPKAKKAA